MAVTSAVGATVETNASPKPGVRRSCRAANLTSATVVPTIPLPEDDRLVLIETANFELRTSNFELPQMGT
ncbi:MAG: hypothetical protein ACM4AI_08205 [Acidobacteriota bacterium]